MKCEKCGADTDKKECVHCGHTNKTTYYVYSGKKVFKVRCTEMTWQGGRAKFWIGKTWVGTFIDPKAVIESDNVMEIL